LPEKKVHQTPEERNFVYLVPLTIERKNYEIYFMLQRARPKDDEDLRLTVESAYPSENATTFRKRPNSIRFQILAHKIFTKSPIRFAPR
jgi:hypothetical protein